MVLLTRRGVYHKNTTLQSLPDAGCVSNRLAARYYAEIIARPAIPGVPNDGTWRMADYDREGIPDLVFIKTNNSNSSSRFSVRTRAGPL
jgi:hypothetical protein